MSTLHYVAYRRSRSAHSNTDFRLPKDFRVERWRPSLTEIAPPGQERFARYVFSWFKAMIGCGGYESIVICHRPTGRVAHVSSAFGRDFKHPFMEQNDLMVGLIKTHPDFRGKGLAKFAIQEILHATRSDEGDIWYMTDPRNEMSRRTALCNGFALVGNAIKEPRFGTPRLGIFQIESVS